MNMLNDDYQKENAERTAGGFGVYAAEQESEALLRRSVMANLLWEDNFYQDGKLVSDQIKELVPQVEAETVANIAVEARTEQKLRHTPLLIAREMAKYSPHKSYLSELLTQIIKRADELSKFLEIYWQDRKQPIAKQVKIGLANAFYNFDEYQFAKWRGSKKDKGKISDVLRLVHPKPRSESESELFRRIKEDELKTPDTWEVAISSASSPEEKRLEWERLLTNRKLGALAFLRNLRNMDQVSVDEDIIKEAFRSINPGWLLPLNFFSAAKFAPNWTNEIEKLMIRSLDNAPTLSGYTVFVVDVSGSMNAPISKKSQFNRFDVAKAMTIMAQEMSEDVSIYVTAGDDFRRIHSTELIEPGRGFEVGHRIDKSRRKVGNGGIFTRQCLNYIREQEGDVAPDRIIVFSDSQDCDWANSGYPEPFGEKNYIIDVSSHTRGINYEGIWTAEISGWSEQFLNYIKEFERVASVFPIIDSDTALI